MLVAVVGWFPIFGGLMIFGGFDSCSLRGLVEVFCIWMLWVSSGFAALGLGFCGVISWLTGFCFPVGLT